MSIFDKLFELKIANKEKYTELFRNTVESVRNGTFDFSGITNLSGEFRIDSNENLTGIINPSSNKIITAYYINNTGISTLDISGLTGLGGTFTAYNCPRLNSVNFPDSSQSFTQFQMYSDPSLTSLNVSKLTNFGGNFSVRDCSTLMTLTLPTTLARQFTVFNAKNCSLNTASIDAALLKLHNLYDASAPIANIIINFDGSNGNAWPTDGSSNVNYLGIYSAFNAVGKNASININYPPAAAPEVLYMSFFTDASGANTFDPTFTIN